MQNLAQRYIRLEIVKEIRVLIQPTNTCPKSTIEALKKCVRYLTKLKKTTLERRH